jgi:thiopurine S-methyltransferase
MLNSEDRYQMNFWTNKWNSNQSYWHISEVNPVLKKYENKLIPNPTNGTTILFPLCGKTVDMLYFVDKGYNVVGIEGVEAAILEYLRESDIKYNLLNVDHKETKLKVFTAGKLTIICANYFTTEPLKPTKGIPDYATRKVDAVFDRGSMMAVLPSLVNNYVKFMKKWINSGAKILLYAPEFDQNLMYGPSYSLSEKKIIVVYGDITKVEILETVIGSFFDVESAKRRRWLISFQ